MNPSFERLREERVRLGMTQDQLAEAGGVQRRAQSNYETGGRTPDLAYLASVAVHGVDVLYVITGRREPCPGDMPLGPKVGAPVKPYPVTPDTTASGALPGRVDGGLLVSGDTGEARPLVLPVKWAGRQKREYQVIPRATMAASAGIAGDGEDGVVFDQLPTDVAGVLALDREWMRGELGRDGPGFVTLKVAGNSMEHTLRDNSTVVLDTAVREVVADGIYAIQVNRALLIKRVMLALDGTLRVRSDNPAYAAGDMDIPPDQAHRVRIVGRLVWPHVR